MEGLRETPQQEPGAGWSQVALVARRYTPLWVAALTVVLIAVLLPSRSPTDRVSALGAQGSSPEGQAAETATFEPGEPGSSPAATATSGQPAPGGTLQRPGVRAGPRSTGGSGAAGPVGGSAGLARSGVVCTPGARQVSWTTYSVSCVPTFSGSNGGKTSDGVTADTITITYRRASSTQDAAISAALGDANLNDELYIKDLQTYIDFFNKQFELYGRKVKLVVFEAQGDYIAEDQGLDQGQAAADAQQAKSLGAFLDITFPLKSSYPYQQALYDKKVITVAPTGFPDGWYAARAPYWYSTFPTGTLVASWLINLVCRRMVGLPAIFAGAPYTNQARRFGLIHPENPEYVEIAGFLKDQLGRCGASIAREVSYTINVAQFGVQATNTIAQMQSAGVTTVLCYCDPVYPIFLSRSAKGQNYFPEWWMPAWGDPQGQGMDQDVWSHAMVPGGQYPSRSEDEAYRVFKLIQPNGEPAQQYFQFAYGQALLVFNVLQAAGPTLTPQSFARAWFSIGKLSGRLLDVIDFAPGRYSPIINLQLGWWDPRYTSQFNQKPGGYRNCEGGRFFPGDLSRGGEWGSGQPRCFGR